MATIKRALISCHDKTGLDVFAKALIAQHVELIASGGTAAFLAQHGLSVTTVESFAGISEQLDGRVKTLHPKIHAGILARRADPAHLRATGAEGLIDLVVVNLYPFEATIQQAGTSLAQAVEHIDIGGVALLRGAAKNFTDVAVVSAPAQYPRVMDALRAGQGTLPAALLREFSVAAFQLTSRYDALIAEYLGRSPSGAPAAGPLPATAALQLRRQQVLRYGENPHQQGAWYLEAGQPPQGLAALTQWQGKELSYNNLLDMDAALRCLLEFEAPACAIIKHHSQCGIASHPDVAAAYERAYACDPESAFGGIVGLNRPVDAALAQRLSTVFLEVILAPAVAEEAKAVLAKKPNLRVVTLPWPARGAQPLEWRQLFGAWLGQQADAHGSPGALKVVTQRAPSAAEQADLQFAWMAAKHVLSNGIVIAKDQATVGIGQGQPSRVGSVRAAVARAGDKIGRASCRERV
jgi:phosphoribosylaminoimidazolecarboxamide formyltransferase/IMP cyclohydrolase